MIIGQMKLSLNDKKTVEIWITRVHIYDEHLFTVNDQHKAHRGSLLLLAGYFEEKIRLIYL